MTSTLQRYKDLTEGLLRLGRAHRDDRNHRVGNPFLDPDGFLNGVFVERVDGGRHPFALQGARFGVDLNVGCGRSLFNANDDVHGAL